MTMNRTTRRAVAMFGIAAAISMGALTACGTDDSEAPSETSTTTTTTTTTPAETTTAPPLSPTENAPRIDPNNPNPFSPPVIAPPAPGADVGDH